MISCAPEVPAEAGEDRVGDGLGDGLVAGEIAEVGERGVGAVQHPELHQLERAHVGDELHADGGEVGPGAGDEGVLDHPLPEGLVQHRREVEPAGELARRRSMSSGLVAGTMRSTIVEGKAPSAAIQSARAGSTRPASSSTTPRTIAPLSGRLSQQSTVKGASPGGAAARERADEEARRRARRLRVGEVVDDVGVGAVQRGRWPGRGSSPSR